MDSENLRDVLTYSYKIKKDAKCINCDGTGWVNWNIETGENMKAGRSYKKNNTEEMECESCDGVGYII